MGSNRRMDHMTWPEFKEAKTRPVIVPIGSTEQHGQHSAHWHRRGTRHAGRRRSGGTHRRHRAAHPELRIQVQAALRWRAAVPGHYRH